MRQSGQQGAAESERRPLQAVGGGAAWRGERLTSELASTLSDEALMERLASGDPDALGPLYTRYVRLVFTIASQSLDHSAAEDLVQEVFLVVWRRAETFDPARGPFRAWILEIAHSRVLNELRRRSRRPRLLPDQAEDHLQLLADPAPGPTEAVLRGQSQEVVAEALETLPPEQQQAVRLAFFSEMTHEQVATTTAVPLGTAKSRIRTGLRRLRMQLNPLLVGGLALAVVSGSVVYEYERELAARNDRALRLVTTSDLAGVRLLPTGDAPADSHGVYRGRPGADVAVLTVSSLPPLERGTAYQAWARIDGRWHSLGIVPGLDAAGHALMIAEGAELATVPDMVMVTVEAAGGASQPSSHAVIVWSAE